MPTRRQCAVIPFVTINGKPHILLITSRETGRWVLPKGWPKKGRPLHKQAKREAFEEAGVVGRVGRTKLGHFSYAKQLKNGKSVTCKVEVYPMQVKTQYLTWPEKQERKQNWLPPQKAAALVAEKDLSLLLKSFDPKKLKT